MAEDLNSLARRDVTELMTSTGRTSFGVVRILSDVAGTPGDEREYEPGDEAVVAAGAAEWVVAPVHLPAAGRRLDHDAERAATPLGGVEAYPPAVPTTSERNVEARREGFVKAHSGGDFDKTLAAKRAEVTDALVQASDAARQASLGGLGARSGPVTAPSDLPADKALADASAAGDEKSDDKSARSGGSAPGRKSN